MGFEALNVYQSYELWQKALLEDYKIVLAFTSNAISCGLRDIIAELCRYKLVDFVITTGGGLEEDVIKSEYSIKIAPIVHKNTEDDTFLYEAGVNRTQNLYFPNDGYVFFQSFIKALFNKRPELKHTTVRTLAAALGSELNCDRSYLRWCSVNNIDVIAGGVEDCAIGDYFAVTNFKSEKDKNLILNCGETLTDYLKFLLKDRRKVCVIALGGGFVKHMAMNGCIPRGGADIAIYMNNEPFYTGSNAGADPSEAVSWGKLKPANSSQSVKVFGDFLLPFYLVASSILKKYSYFRTKNKYA